MNEATVSNTTSPDDPTKFNYFTTRLTEAQLAYEREKAAAEATLKAEQRMLERAISKLLRKLSPEELADVLEVSLDQVNKIATKQNSVIDINELRGNTFTPPIKTTDVGNKSTFMQKEAPISNLAYLEMLSNSPYFVSRRNEAQLSELRYKAEKQTAEKIIYKLLIKFSPEEVVDLLGAPLAQVHRIAESNYSFININKIYKAAISVTNNPDGISKADYYTKPLSKAQLAYERKETEQETVEGTISMLLKKLSQEVVADALEMPLDQVINIAKGRYYRIDFNRLWESAW